MNFVIVTGSIQLPVLYVPFPFSLIIVDELTVVVVVDVVGPSVSGTKCGVLLEIGGNIGLVGH